MKVLIEFDPIEDKFALEAAMKATDMWLVLKHIVEHVRKDVEFYEERGLTEGESALKSIQHKLNLELTDNGLDNLIFNY